MEIPDTHLQRFFVSFNHMYCMNIFMHMYELFKIKRMSEIWKKKRER